MRRDELELGLPADLAFRSPVPWTAVLYTLLLGLLHLAVAVPAFLSGRWEAYLSLGLGLAFAVAALVVGRVRSEVHVHPSRRRVVVRTGLAKFRIERAFGFDQFSGVRLTLLPGGGAESKIELLSDAGDVECPPTTVPRQEALLLAITLGVPLVRVSGRHDGAVGDAGPGGREPEAGGRAGARGE